MAILKLNAEIWNPVLAKIPMNLNGAQMVKVTLADGQEIKGQVHNGLELWIMGDIPDQEIASIEQFIPGKDDKR